MTKQPKISGPEVDPGSLESLAFHTPVSISGHHYVFEGNLPEAPTSFKWGVRVAEGVPVESFGEMMDGDRLDHGEIIDLMQEGLGEGRVGLVDAKLVRSSDDVDSIELRMIRTNTRYLPTEAGYSDAEGIGSFLLDNLCSFADSRGWRIYLQPSDEGGKLNDAGLREWYERRGFQYGSGLPREARIPGLSMQRAPKPRGNGLGETAISQFLKA
jgi:hypothetical protein